MFPIINLTIYFQGRAVEVPVVTGGTGQKTVFPFTVASVVAVTPKERSLDLSPAIILVNALEDLSIC